MSEHPSVSFALSSNLGLGGEQEDKMSHYTLIVNCIDVLGSAEIKLKTIKNPNFRSCFCDFLGFNSNSF